MKALIFANKGEVKFIDKPEPKIKEDDDIVVKILASGICGTDLKILQGKFHAKKQVILGHEAIGIVQAVGEKVTHVKINDRVVIDPTYYCGMCTYCLRSKVNFCDNKVNNELGVDCDGTHAEYCKISARFVYKLPDKLTLEQAVLIEPLACVINNLTAAHVNPADRVLVYGGGPIGLLTTLLCQQWSSKVTLVETNYKRARFAKKFIKNVIDNVSLRKKSPFGDEKPNIVVDTVGTSLEQALQAVDKGGKIVLMGFNNNYQANIKPLYITNNGIQIIGAGDYRQHIAAAIDMAAEIPIGYLITHKFSLAEYQSAFDILSNPTKGKQVPMKVVFIPEQKKVELS